MTTATALPTIAIVDDDPSVQKALGRLLGSVGYPVLTYGTGRAFLDDQERDSVSCLVLDVHMPEWGGLDLQAELVASGSTLPIIFITGRRNPEARTQALREGAVAFLEKPFDEVTLLDAVSEALVDADG